jgi:hypothetical protein
MRDVPAGAYTLVVWHETLGRHERELRVPAEGTLTAEKEARLLAEWHSRA